MCDGLLLGNRIAMILATDRIAVDGFNVMLDESGMANVVVMRCEGIDVVYDDLA